MIPINFLS
ncbi:hypothetical protein F383_26739 [Gossypium arboreum]|uniref:Uncharacterized protein n=1 Tax=Gossypium arboreum TaxID=29729 RepID=A0A0B0PAN6_GOSAR|nr:hypothetical protein F383_26739 [Gossypium arboreum]